MVTPESEMRLAHNAIDRANPHLRDETCRAVTCSELQREQGTIYSENASPEHLRRQIDHLVAAVSRLCDNPAALKPEVLISLGGDQEELLSHENARALAITLAPP